jgi:hypothetical protein
MAQKHGPKESPKTGHLPVRTGASALDMLWIIRASALAPKERFQRLRVLFLDTGRSMSFSRRKKMIKTLLFAGFASALAMGAASAADLCNDDHMKQMDQMIADMTDEAKQKEAMTALDQSKAAMKDGDTDECMKYMGEAHAAMGL